MRSVSDLAPLLLISPSEDGPMLLAARSCALVAADTRESWEPESLPPPYKLAEIDGGPYWAVLLWFQRCFCTWTGLLAHADS